MPKYTYRLIDQNTGEEVYPSDGFGFDAPPTPEHQIRDAELMSHYGGPAIVNRVEEKADGDAVEVLVYVDGAEERVNAGNEDDENYRRS